MRITLRAFTMLTAGLLLTVSSIGCQTCSDCHGFHVRERFQGGMSRVRSGVSRLGLPRLGMPGFLSRTDSRHSSDSFQPVEPMAVPYEPGPHDTLVLPEPAPSANYPPARLQDSTVPPAVPSFDEDRVPSAGLTPPRRIDNLRPINHEVPASGEKGVIQPVCHEMFGGSCSTCSTGCDKESLLDKLRRAFDGGLKLGKNKCKTCDPCMPVCSPCETVCDPCMVGNEMILEGVVVGSYPMSCDPCFSPPTTWIPPTYHHPPAYAHPPMHGYHHPHAPAQAPCNCQRQQTWRSQYPAGGYPQQYPQQSQYGYPQQPGYGQPQQPQYQQPPHQQPQGYGQPQTGHFHPTPAAGPTPVPGVQQPTPVPNHQPTPVTTYQPGYSPVQPTYSPVGVNAPHAGGFR